MIVAQPVVSKTIIPIKVVCRAIVLYIVTLPVVFKRATVSDSPSLPAVPHFTSAHGFRAVVRRHETHSRSSGCGDSGVLAILRLVELFCHGSPSLVRCGPARPLHCAILLRSRSSLNILVQALATMLLAVLSPGTGESEA
jgi:hypothetical protein